MTPNVQHGLPVVDDSGGPVLLGQADLLLWLSNMLAAPNPLSDGELEQETLSQLFTHAALPEAEQRAASLVSAAAECSELGTEDWRSEYERLFGPELECPIYETSYIRRDKGAVLGDIAGFYRAFGFASRAAERPDHLCAELELVAMLCLSLLRARAERDHEAGEVVLEALEAFTADHLGEWLPLYRELGTLLQLIAASIGCGAKELDLPEHELGTPYECGMAGEAPEVELE